MKRTSIAFVAAVACMPLPALAGGPHGGGGYYHGGYRGGCGFGCGVGAGILGGAILGGALAAPYYYQPYYPPAQPYVWYYCDAAGAYYPYVQSCPSGFRPVAPR
jgi:hypothetical protein